LPAAPAAFTFPVPDRYVLAATGRIRCGALLRQFENVPEKTAAQTPTLAAKSLKRLGAGGLAGRKPPLLPDAPVSYKRLPGAPGSKRFVAPGAAVRYVTPL
ncbi:MAG: hypothetical protein L0Y60_10490, partial [Beijerinckiaceae bacterium]|nr:hypothetical protein [Beijerinckiaceae bacterium]